MHLRIHFKSAFPVNSFVDFTRSNFIFFGDPVRHHCGRCSVEEVKHPIVYSSEPNSQFIDPISQIICLGTAQLMTVIAKPLHFDDAFVPRFGR